MPGLTIQTDAIVPRTSNAATPAPSTSPASTDATVPTAAAAAAAAGAPSSSSFTSSSAAAGASHPPAHTPPRTSRSASPTRPPISPITPTLPPTRLAEPLAPFAADRPVLIHSTQPTTAAASAIPPPRPEPIDFNSNPDVLALKSAISILQLQQKKAAADIQALSQAKNAAIDDPGAFLADLRTGKVHTQGDKLFLNSDSDSDDGSEGSEIKRASGLKRKVSAAGRGKTPEPRPWQSLPKPQNVVRCPPINWSQYAVVGESLDKLHADQLARPSQGAPATLGTNGTYEFTGAPEGNQKPFVGVAAPYTPGKDRIDKKTKGGKR